MSGYAISEEISRKAIERAISPIAEFCKKGLGVARVTVGSSFVRYLENAVKRYNKIKTIATGTEPRPIIGENALYVHIGVSYREKEYPTTAVDPLLKLNRHLLIEGTGGAGKSMMMRYFFLDTAYRGNYVPILLELRRISGAASDGVTMQSVLELVYACMQEFNVALDREQFEYSLASGRYLFLFDGFDEVPDALARPTATAIQAFCSKYPNNPCIVTSRPYADTSSLETFLPLDTMPLAKWQAVMLASRLWDEDEKTREFCHQLDNTLFEQHKDFAQNPLLLTMMFLTFMRNQSIPEHLCEFYQKAYEALYSAHDNQDKGVFKREFKCKTLDERSFASLFAYFCFQSYFKDEYEFTEEQILAYLDKGIKKQGLTDVNAIAYLDDLKNIVCMIVRDGNLYKFSHRSFQTYFAAIYTSKLSDEEQKRLFTNLFPSSWWHSNHDYYELLYQIVPERFAANALEEGLRALQSETNANPDPDLFFFRRIYCGITVIGLEDGDHIAFSPQQPDHNITSLFIKFINNRRCFAGDRDELEKRILDYLNKSIWFHGDIPFTKLDTGLVSIPDEEKRAFYQNLTDFMCIRQIRAAIRDWLAEQEKKRAARESSGDLSTLLDAL